MKNIITWVLALLLHRKEPKTVEIVVPVKMYRTVHELPLTVFIDCYCDGDYTGLAISGSPTHEELVEVWDDLNKQYTEIIGGESVKNRLRSVKDYYKLSTKLQLAEILLTTLDRVQNEELYNQLFTFGYNIPKKPFSPENLSKTIKMFIGYYKLDKVRAVNQEESVKAKSGDDKKASRNDFTKTLNSISIAFKMPSLQIDKLTTAQYCNYVVQYRDYCEEVKKHTKK